MCSPSRVWIYKVAFNKVHFFFLLNSCSGELLLLLLSKRKALVQERVAYLSTQIIEQDFVQFYVT